jgi:hypothetical protein
MAAIIAAMLFLICYFIALVKEGRTIRRCRGSVTSVQSAGYRSLGREPGAVIWLPTATVHEVASITHSSGHWRRTAPRSKEQTAVGKKTRQIQLVGPGYLDSNSLWE